MTKNLYLYYLFFGEYILIFE